MPGDMPRYYWDACVLLAFIQDEPDRAPLIAEMIESAEKGDHELFTSVLSMTEVAFTAAEKASGALDDVMIDQIDALWQPPSPITVVELYPQLAANARELMRKALSRGWALKPPDAIHLPTAQHLAVTKFHTYDDKLERWAEPLGFDLCEPELAQRPML